MACVRDRIQPMTAVKQTGLPFLFSFTLCISLFLFCIRPFTLFHICPVLRALCLHSYFPLCAEVITHSAFILLLLYSHSTLICLRACVMWPRLTVFSWRQIEKPRGCIVTCVLTCRPESFHARLWITLLIQQPVYLRLRARSPLAKVATDWWVNLLESPPSFFKNKHKSVGRRKNACQEFWKTFHGCVGKCWI